MTELLSTPVWGNRPYTTVLGFPDTEPICR